MSWTLGRIVREHARGRGDRPMITYVERVITWAEMDARSSRVAQGLLAAGLAEQSRIAFLDKNGPEYFEVLFGGGKANVVNVAVNWRLTPGEMAYVINDAEAKILFVGPDFLGHLEEMEGSLKSVEKIVVLGAHARHESYEAWLTRHPADDPGRTGDRSCDRLRAKRQDDVIRDGRCPRPRQRLPDRDRSRRNLQPAP